MKVIQYRNLIISIVLLCSVILPWSRNAAASIDSALISQLEGESERNELNYFWSPAVLVFGNGNKTKAIEHMNTVLEIQNSMLTDSWFDAETEKFIEGLWASFEKFDLSRFYWMLPSEENGRRYIHIKGRKIGERFQYEGGGKHRLVKDEFSFNQAGDFSALVSSQKVETDLSVDAYLLRSDISFFLGSAPWPAIDSAITSTFLSITDPFAKEKSEAVYSTTQRVRFAHPALGSEDVAIIAPLWASFPACWTLFSSIVEVTNLVLEPVKGQPYKRLRMALQLKPDAIETNYSELAQFLVRMGSLFNLAMEMHTDRGRIFSVAMDTKALSIEFEAIILRGELLPVDKLGNIVFDHSEVDSPLELNAKVDIEFELLGVIASLKSIKTDILFTPDSKGALMLSKTSSMPEVDVSGSAFGFLPTSVIDFFMPGNIESIVKEFMEVVFNGVNGEGVSMSLHYNHDRTTDLSNVDAGISFVGLNNFFVRMGMRMVNDRIVPSEAVSDDLRKLWLDSKNAFAKDLEIFAASGK